MEEYKDIVHVIACKLNGLEESILLLGSFLATLCAKLVYHLLMVCS